MTLRAREGRLNSSQPTLLWLKEEVNCLSEKISDGDEMDLILSIEFSAPIE
jgi:hypothetical protein